MNQQMDEQLPECAKEWLELLKVMEQQDDPRYKPTLQEWKIELEDGEESGFFYIGDASVFSEEREVAMADVADYLRYAADGLEDE